MNALMRGLIATVIVLAQPVSDANAATYLFHNDHLGTPQALTDSDQQVVWQSEQDPFGEVEEVVNVVEQNLRFAGQYFDVETGLHYNYFRDYDSDTGRYMQSDPIGLFGGLNTYAYVGGNPLVYTDPRGLFWGYLVGPITAAANWTRNYWNEPVDNRDHAEGWTEHTGVKEMFHTQGYGNGGNDKFVAPDGHSEIVFDCSNNVVTDSNMGTFNYFSPDLMGGVPHAVADMLPYMVFGVSPSDMFNPQRFVTAFQYFANGGSTEEECSCEN